MIKVIYRIIVSIDLFVYLSVAFLFVSTAHIPIEVNPENITLETIAPILSTTIKSFLYIFIFFGLLALNKWGYYTYFIFTMILTFSMLFLSPNMFNIFNYIIPILIILLPLLNKKLRKEFFGKTNYG